MHDETEGLKIRREKQAVAREQAAEFLAVAGEAEAERASSALLAGAAADPAGDPTLLHHADSGARARAVSRLQQEHGNSYVQRLVSAAVGPATGALAVQRQTPPPAAGATPPAGAAPPTAAAPAPAAGPSAQTTALWNSAVVAPIGRANELLAAPSRANIRGSEGQLMQSKEALRSVKDTYPESPENATLRAKMAGMGNAILAVGRALVPHVGDLKPIREIRAEMGSLRDWLTELGGQLRG